MPLWVTPPSAGVNGASARWRVAPPCAPRTIPCHSRTDNLAAAKKVAAHLPSRWWFLPTKEGNVRLGSFFGLMHSTNAAAPLSAPMSLNAWLSGHDGDPSGLWFQSVMARLLLPERPVWGDKAAVGRIDVGYAQRRLRPAHVTRSW